MLLISVSNYLAIRDIEIMITIAYKDRIENDSLP